MGNNTGIAWADDTMSPWWGCTEVSPACDHCYAREFDARFGGENWGKDGPRRFFGEKHWNEPLKWDRQVATGNYVGKSGPGRRLVFCASMCDVFEKYSGPQGDILEPWRLKLWGLIKATPRLTWLLLTKRPQNIGRMMPDELRGAHNIWLGTTVESPEYLWRAKALNELGNHAAVRFLSMEPLLADTSIASVLPGINWAIIGSESGELARPTDPAWYRRTRDECVAAGIPVFLKQADEDTAGISARPPEGVPVPTTNPPYRKRDLRLGAHGVKRAHWIVERPYLDGEQLVQWPT